MSTNAPAPTLDETPRGSDVPLEPEKKGGLSGLSSGETVGVVIGGVAGTAVVGVGGARGVEALAKTDGVSNVKFGADYVANAIKNSIVGKTTNALLTGIQNSAVGKFVAKVVATTLGKTVSKAMPFVPDAAVIGFNLYQDISAEDVTDLRRGLNITGSIVGGIGDISMSILSAAFPALIVLQVGGAILDMAWDPFKNYFNSDLITMKKQFDKEYGKALRKSGLDWPLEVKPEFLRLEKSDPNYPAKLNEILGYIQKYYDNNGIIQPEDVLAEEELFVKMQNVKRLKSFYSYDENGELVLVEPNLTAIDFKTSTDQNILLSLALAAYIKKNNLARRTRLDYFLLYLKHNWLSLFFFIFLILSTTIVLHFTFKLNIMKTYIIAIVLLVAFLLLFGISFYAQTETETFESPAPEPTIELFPQCENMTPQTLLAAFNNDIDKLTDAILQAGISIESLKIPGLYPYIASALVQKNLLVC